MGVLQRMISISILTDILSSDDLFSHPYLKCAVDVSTSLILYSYRPSKKREKHKIHACSINKMVLEKQA